MFHNSARLWSEGSESSPAIFQAKMMRNPSLEPLTTIDPGLMLPASILVATIALVSGAAGATFFSPPVSLVLRLTPLALVGTAWIAAVLSSQAFFPRPPENAWWKRSPKAPMARKSMTLLGNEQRRENFLGSGRVSWEWSLTDPLR